MSTNRLDEQSYGLDRLLAVTKWQQIAMTGNWNPSPEFRRPVTAEPADHHCDQNAKTTDEGTNSVPPGKAQDRPLRSRLLRSRLYELKDIKLHKVCGRISDHRFGGHH